MPLLPRLSRPAFALSFQLSASPFQFEVLDDPASSTDRSTLSTAGSSLASALQSGSVCALDYASKR